MMNEGVLETAGCGFRFRLVDNPSPASCREFGKAEEAWADDELVVIRSTLPSTGIEAQPTSFGIKVVLAGEETCLLDRRALVLRPGSILLLPEGTSHRTKVSPNTHSVSVYFPVELTRSSIVEETIARGSCEARQLDSLRQFPVHVRPVREEMLEALEALALAGSTAEAFDIALKLLRPALDLVSTSRREMDRIPAVRASSKSDLFRRAAAARAALEEEPGLTLGDLADVSCLSPFHLHRVFTAAFGLPPGQFAKQRKIEISRGLLRGTELPVKSVAHQAGFVNSSAFVRSFRSECGITPLEYRRSA